MFGKSAILYRYNTLFRRGILTALAQTVLLWSARSRQRRALANLDQRQLRDIGIDRMDAILESRKPFWRA